MVQRPTPAVRSLSKAEAQGQGIAVAIRTNAGASFCAFSKKKSCLVQGGVRREGEGPMVHGQEAQG